MTEHLRVLQVEDHESDAALIVRLLEKAGYAVEAERVEDAAAMRAALSQREWDVIIADYRLPVFDAPSALRILLDSGGDIPFIVVSGTVGEVLAVEMMRAGAHDYLMKDSLARLAPAVKREVREARDRRERRRAEERLALAVTATRCGTFDYYPQTGELIWSDVAKRQFGLSPAAEASYETFLRALHPDDRDRVDRAVQETLRPGGSGWCEIEFRTIGLEDRMERWLAASGRAFFDSDGRAVRFVGVNIETTERKQLEEQYRQAQKLESVGRLAGGVAHDFNNLLTVIGGYAHMAAEELAPRHPLREALAEITKASDRAGELTRQLLAFSRRQVTAPKNISLNDLVRGVEKMIRRLIGEDIELVVKLDPEAGSIWADSGQIEQVIVNLAVNAKDAMPSGGKLVIETATLVAGEQFAQARLSVSPGPYVRLTVSDTGTGMTAETKTHIFEPFFTTKEAGKGTGLGLSTVYGIVQQSKGTIWVTSEPGLGASFEMLFPATGEKVAPAPPEPVSSHPLGSETILLAEDEPGLRGFVKHELVRHGYTVLAAANGREAIDLARDHGKRIDLLLADIVMPEMGGASLAEKFSQEYPGVPIVLMSGYHAEEALNGRRPSHFLQKPFTSAALLTRLREVLNR